jgi:sec-independent protein translocase protein TatC
MLQYLIELRQKLLISLFVFACLFLFCFYFANELFLIVASPLLTSLSSQSELIATEITAPLLIPIKLAANTALLLTAPFVLFQLWRFTVPALYKRERKPLKGAVWTSLVLFCLGVLFCYYLILPFLFQCLVNAVPMGVKMMPDISNSLDFITRMLLIFGIFFQIPLICLTLSQLQWIDMETLTRLRPYVIVAAFIIGMLLTPPDVLSQILLAVPLCLLYEFGILLVKWRCL